MCKYDEHNCSCFFRFDDNVLLIPPVTVVIKCDHPVFKRAANEPERVASCPDQQLNFYSFFFNPFLLSPSSTFFPLSFSPLPHMCSYVLTERLQRKLRKVTHNARSLLGTKRVRGEILLPALLCLPLLLNQQLPRRQIYAMYVHSQQYVTTSRKNPFERYFPTLRR